MRRPRKLKLKFMEILSKFIRDVFPSRLDFDLGVKLYNATIRNPATKSTFIRFLQVDKRYQVKHYTAKFPEMHRLFQEFLRDVANPSDSVKRYEKIKV